MLSLENSIVSIRSVGPSLQLSLNKKEIETVGDLTRYYPLRYLDIHEHVPISALRAGMLATIVVTVYSGYSRRAKSGRTSIQQFTAEDETGKIQITFFNQPFLIKQFKKNERYLFYGTASFFGRSLTFNPREYLHIEDGSETATGVLPLYSAIPHHSQRFIRKLIHNLLPEIDAEELAEPLPEALVNKRSLLNPLQTIHALHEPESIEQTQQGRRRLVYDELLSYVLPYQKLAVEYQKKKAIQLKTQVIDTIQTLLPFTLTKDQRQSLIELKNDLQKKSPMKRMLIGEVGSGKTIIAASALFAAASSNRQAILLAPTEVLAQQHALTIKKLFSSLNKSVMLMTGSSKEMVLGAQSKKPSIIIATHAILYSDIDIENCACVVVDEQHKFGVQQRDSLMERAGGANITPHLLMLSATPIPRSLALSMYGGVSLSWLTTMPANRKPVITRVITPEKRADLYTWLEKQLAAGKQAFVVCPAIEEDEENSDASSVEQVVARLQKRFPDTPIDLLYSNLQDKNSILSKFRDKKTQILVCTTVIEVGIDIPDATIMIIEEADMFGLAQLHQLRGRVGRNEKQGYCIALYAPKESSDADKRLSYFQNELNGFTIAEYDLKLRGPGSIVGYSQSGFPFRYAKDHLSLSTFKEIHSDIQELLAIDPHFTYNSVTLPQLKQSEVTHLH